MLGMNDRGQITVGLDTATASFPVIPWRSE
jgi:hypothetical protein